MAMPADRTPVTRLLVVRHGQSEWNAAGQWQGRADPPFTFVLMVVYGYCVGVFV